MLLPDVENGVAVNDSIKFEVQTVQAVEFGMVYNGQAIVRQLSVASLGGQSYSDATLTVEVTSLGERFSEPWSRELAVVGPQPVRFDDIQINLNSDLLYQINDQRQGKIEIKLSAGDLVLGRHEVNVPILAPNSWVMNFPFTQFGSSLSAHVMPNDPILRGILDEALPILTALDGDPAWSGYQAGPKHVHAMAEAIYSAVQARQLTYVNPPAGWDLQSNPHTAGQRVRTPSEVIGERAGTCLDTATLLAALFENIGLRPILFIVPGHAFVGYWRDEDFRPSSTVEPLHNMLNYLDHGLIAALETTTLCTSMSEPFDLAVERGRRRISGDFESEDSVAIDVTYARRYEGIKPIPNRVIAADGTIEIHEYRPQDLTISKLQAALRESAGTKAGVLADDSPERVAHWKKSLLDLSLRNSLINFRSPSSCVPLVLPKGASAIVEDMLQQGREINLHPKAVEGAVNARGLLYSNQDDETLLNILAGNETLFVNMQPDTFVTRMRRMASNAKSIIDQSGTNNLYLAIGMLVWTPEGDALGKRAKGEISSPLILLPVTVKPFNRSRAFKISIDESGTITPNFSLIEKLAKDINLKLPKLATPDLDDSGIDVNGVFAYVREELAKAQLDFRVDESCTLGFFDFSTYRLWRDLADNWPKFVENPLVKHLVYTGHEPFGQQAVDHGQDLDELAAELPISTDGSQVEAVARAITGQTFVLQGPPGTGKSQTITNLIAKAITAGQKVLFIAEKPAALNVVKERIDSIGLGNFCLDLHDKGMRPASVRQQLANTLDYAVVPDKSAQEIFEANHARTIAQLKRYPQRLHAIGQFGISAYEANDRLLVLTEAKSVPIDRAFMVQGSADAKRKATEVLREIDDIGLNAGTAATNPWSLSTLHPNALDAGLFEKLDQAVENATTALVIVLNNDSTRRALESIAEWSSLSSFALFNDADRPELSEVDAASSEPVKQSIRSLQLQLDELAARMRELPVPHDFLSRDLNQLLAQAEAANASFVLVRKKKVLGVSSLVSQVTPSDPIEDGVALIGLIRRLLELQEFARNCQKAGLDIGCLNLPATWNPLNTQEVSAIKSRVDYLWGWDKLVGLGSGAQSNVVRDIFQNASLESSQDLARLSENLNDIQSLLNVDEPSITVWLRGRSLGVALAEVIPEWKHDIADRDHAQLKKWSALSELCSQLSDLRLPEMAQYVMSGQISYDDVADAFERSFFEAIIKQQFDEQNLGAFDGAAQDRAIETFAGARQGLVKTLPGVLAAKVIQLRGFDGNVNIGAVGELRREISRQRGGKSVRSLLRDYWGVITKITPCIMASPDSVARFLQADMEKFDLVIFDEASQIRVANAIGAMGRAKTVIVVGDSKQMPPSSIAAISMVDDDLESEGTTLLEDQESILTECTLALVPDVMLSWHYRSQDESLIAFSNQQYYDGRLSSFPSAQPNATNTGVSFVNVGGHFNRTTAAKDGPLRTNPIEARAIVEEITRRLHDPIDSKSSIGVVTFNLQQKALIEDMLANSDDELVQQAFGETEGESLFVKNLESVQGDERDIIIFSIAFSKNDKNVVPLNFGPLNNTGGERRLNVAITRARQQNLIFASFEPEELRAENSASVGLRHLRTFLEMAKYGPESAGVLAGTSSKQVDRHRDQIAGELSKVGLSVETSVGLSEFKVDIAVRHPSDPGRRILGIVLDGPLWASRSVASDRDTLPNAILTNKMNWLGVARIWLPTWLSDAAAETQRIVDLVDQLVHEESLAPAPAIEIEQVSAVAPQDIPLSVVPVKEAAPPDVWSAIPFWKPAVVIARGDKSDLDNSVTAAQVVPQVASGIVSAEGPVEPRRLGRLVGQTFGLQRVTENRVDEILRRVGKKFVVDEEGFLYPEGTELATFTSWRRSTSSLERKIEEISLIEIANAAKDIAHLGMGLGQSDLIKEVAAVFAYSRVAAATSLRIEKAIKFGLKSGRLVETDGRIHSD